MIGYMNKYYGKDYHFIYSTPQTYIDQVKKYDVAWSTRYDDFFPYADSMQFNLIYYAVWTGFYSSRPNLKAQVRRASR